MSAGTATDATGTATAAPWADTTTLGQVRPGIRDLLLRSKAVAQLSGDEQRQLAREMVKITTYLATPEGLVTGAAPTPRPAPPATALAQEDPTTAARRAAIG